MAALRADERLVLRTFLEDSDAVIEGVVESMRPARGGIWHTFRIVRTVRGTPPGDRVVLFAHGAGMPDAAELPKGACGRILRNRDVLLLTISYMCMNMVFYIFFAWFFIYLVDVRGFDALEGGLLSALPWIAAAVGATVGGELCDRLSRRIGPRWGCRIPAIAGLLASAVFLFVGAAAPNAFLAIALLSLCFAGNQFTDGAFWQGTISVSGRYAAAGCGVLNTGGNFAGIVATPMVPILKDQFGWYVALSSGAVFAVIGAVLWLFIRADRVMEDVSAPGTFLEYFVTSSWLDHLRQHDRVTVDDRELQVAIAKTQVDGYSPHVRHFVGGAGASPRDPTPRPMDLQEAP